MKIETDPNPALVEKYAVYGLPTVMLFKGGQAVDGSKREGASRLLGHALGSAPPDARAARDAGAITKVKLLAHLADFGVTP